MQSKWEWVYIVHTHARFFEFTRFNKNPSRRVNKNRPTFGRCLQKSATMLNGVEPNGHTHFVILSRSVIIIIAIIESIFLYIINNIIIALANVWCGSLWMCLFLLFFSSVYYCLISHWRARSRSFSLCLSVSLNS